MGYFSSKTLVQYGYKYVHKYMYCTPHEICVIYICLQNWSMPTPYQIWGEDLNRISKYNFDSTET